jgi:hypothetical protein
MVASLSISRTANAIVSIGTEQANDHAVDDGRLALYFDSLVRRILRHEEGPLASIDESLECGFTLDRRGHDITGGGDGLLAHDDMVTLENAGVLHAVARHPKREEVTALGPIRRDREQPLDILFCNDGNASGDASDDGNASGVSDVAKTDTTAPAPGQVDVAFARQRLEMVPRCPRR